MSAATILGFDTRDAATTRRGDARRRGARRARGRARRRRPPAPRAAAARRRSRTAAERAGGWDGGRRDRRRHRAGLVHRACGSAIATARGARAGARARRSPASRRSRALARGIAERRAGDRPCCAVIDARRGEVFAALYAAPADGAAGSRSSRPRRSSRERVGRLARAPLAAGDGSVRFQARARGCRGRGPRRRRSGAPALGAAHLPRSPRRSEPRPARASRADLPETTRRGALA